ncbi:HAD-IIB family hydrolase [Planococcus donghaensis]|uniref:Hydrolase n=1 Tax=Planococcus donghaensis TaxID=414778 RepID=A0A1C7EKZ1_9BACL|nr:HAD-IIB family hydrolase [Planococcus donghaensis]ANU24326.1 hydrolase [Planococcus donghaensis]
MDAATHLLATDLDGTLVGDKYSLQALFNFYDNQTYEVSLIYITGRHYQSALSLITEENLPVPDVLITDVGTAIYIGDSLEQDLAWSQHLEQSWLPQKIDTVARQIPGLVSQELPITNRCSYYATDETVVEAFRTALDQAEISYKLIYSGGRDVDILPAGSGKGQALQYILNKYQLDEAKLLVAGDSGNDTEMLTLGFPSVIVGNAQPELLEQQKHPSIYRATNSYAGGIHEAWRYFYTK